MNVSKDSMYTLMYCSGMMDCDIEFYMFKFGYDYGSNYVSLKTLNGIMKNYFPKAYIK